MLKGLDELAEFGGTDDYVASLVTIVKAYPETGIMLTKVRGVLPDSVVLDGAIQTLLNEKKITAEPSGKRSLLLKPRQEMATSPVVIPPQSGDIEVQAESTQAAPAKKPSVKPAKPADDDTQD